MDCDCTARWSGMETSVCPHIIFHHWVQLKLKGIKKSLKKDLTWSPTSQEFLTPSPAPGRVSPGHWMKASLRGNSRSIGLMADISDLFVHYISFIMLITIFVYFSNSIISLTSPDTVMKPVEPITQFIWSTWEASCQYWKERRQANWSQSLWYLILWKVRKTIENNRNIFTRNKT